ncbi:unnamed protein product [Diamesa tonsa]
MADEEQFSLCWNNFNTNLSAGFHESLCRGDLVDVTLAAEGQLVKAHRLVLSVCSPYFRKMFTQMPANQHAFGKLKDALIFYCVFFTDFLFSSMIVVFLKDVSAAALKDLIQFMYCGEVNVKQEALPAFISTAEALQIKGLTESNEQTATATTSAASPAKEVITSTPLPDTIPRTRARVVARPQAFKIESEGSSDEKQTVSLVQSQSAKRVARHVVSAAPKRIKIQQTNISHTIDTNDPLDAPDSEMMSPQQLKVSETTEFIDLPIESSSLNPKTEPEYVEDAQEIETAEQDDDTYVEDVTYGEEKYDETYFTEGDETKAGVSGFSETYQTEGDQSATEAQGHIKFMRSQKGKPQLIFRDYIYNKKITYANGNSNWRCAEFIKYKCLSSCLTKNNKLVRYRFSHQHPAPTRKLIKKLFSYDINDQCNDGTCWFIKSRKGGLHLVHGNFVYRSNLRKQGVDRNVIYWECVFNRKNRCRGRLKTVDDKLFIANSNATHNHPMDMKRIDEAKNNGSFIMKSLSEIGKVEY